jgi:hypothetical protein
MSMPPVPEHDRARLDKNIRRTTAIAALRKIRVLVEEYGEERLAERRFTRTFISLFLVVCLAAALLAATGHLDALLRIFQSALQARPDR